MKQCKKCKKSISDRTGELCRDCYMLEHHQKRRAKQMEEHKCLRCGDEVEPEEVYYTRCKKCRKKTKEKQND